MSDDLIERMERGVRRHDRKAADNNQVERKMAKEAAARIRELESRLATAEADALERAAKEIECGCKDECLCPRNCSREDAAAIRALMPKASE